MTANGIASRRHQPSRYFTVSSAKRLGKRDPTEWYRKHWGWTRPIAESPEESLHELKVEAGGYCSIHVHEYRSNVFYVQEGKVSVVWLNKDRSVWSERILTPSKKLEIPAGVWHMFKAWTDGAMFERYLPANNGRVRSSDIRRHNEGGKVPVSELANIPGYPVPVSLI